jgi:drug/metabolite transporter (DMT)-like permease
MIAAVAAFSFMDAIMKLLAATYPPMEVAALRGVTSLPFTVLPVLLAGRLRDLTPRRWRMHLLRGVLSVGVLGGFIYGVRTLSLANTYSVFLSAPLLVAALSVPLLREHIEWRRWLAIVAGLAGVLIMLRPSSAGLAWIGALATFAGALCYAFSSIAVRVLTRTDTTVSVVFWTISLMSVFTACIAAPGWVPITHEHWKWLVALGVLAVVAPFEYTALPWAVLIDRVAWHVEPSGRVCLGGGIVIASGLYLMLRERTVRAEARRATIVEVTSGAGQNVAPSMVREVARQQEEESP